MTQGLGELKKKMRKCENAIFSVRYFLNDPQQTIVQGKLSLLSRNIQNKKNKDGFRRIISTDL